MILYFFFFKQKTAYDMRISDWSSDVCSSDLLSIPSMGASGFGYELARQFGHAVLPTRAGLVPLTLSGKHQERLTDLSGVALPVTASCNGQDFSNYLLVTHRGISGPSILQVSSYWQPRSEEHTSELQSLM